MTGPLSEELSHCYSLLYVAEKELKTDGCQLRALLCFENCRRMAEQNMKKNMVYNHCLLRASRKESQLLRKMGLHRRAYRVLKKVEKLVGACSETTDKFLVYVGPTE